MPVLNLIKLCVGAEAVEDLLHWQAQPRAQGPDGLPRHITRMWPKREAEILAGGGSLYWVFKGAILCRQTVVRLDEYNSADGIRRCAIVLDKQVIRVAPTRKRPFQGWRYLKAEDAPPDLGVQNSRVELPPQVERALADIGVM